MADSDGYVVARSGTIRCRVDADGGWERMVYGFLTAAPRPTADALTVAWEGAAVERDPLYCELPPWDDGLRAVLGWIWRCAIYGWRQATGRLRREEVRWRLDGVRLWAFEGDFRFGAER